MTMPAGSAAVGRGDPEAAVKVASRLLLPSRMETESSPWLTPARSGTASPFTSAVAMATGDWPTAMGELVASVNVMLELASTELNKTATLLVDWFTTARSIWGLLFAELVALRKLPLTMATGPFSKTVE